MLNRTSPREPKIAPASGGAARGPQAAAEASTPAVNTSANRRPTWDSIIHAMLDFSRPPFHANRRMEECISVKVLSRGRTVDQQCPCFRSVQQKRDDPKLERD